MPMLRATWKRSAWLLWIAISCGSALGCSDARPEASVGGDTHWLQACTEDADCERGSCLCGVCTESCTRDVQCAGEVEARCTETELADVAAACAARAEPQGELPGICLARCADVDGDVDVCTDGLECSADVCVPASTAAPGAEPPVAVSERPSRRASEFADLEPSATLSFEDEVVPVPEPARSFSDPAEALLGTWRQPDCDPADGETQYFSGGGCVTLVFERSEPDGMIVGRLDSYTEVDTSEWEVPKQTFAPAEDPDIGYPVGVAPEDYFNLRGNPRIGPYTMFDPHFDGQRLQFWLSPLELWEGWCALQTSYRVPGGSPPYQCVPDGAATGDVEVDYGKLVLCTSSWSSGECVLSICGDFGNEPCESGQIVGCGCAMSGDEEGNPECSIEYCRCDAEGCAPNWYEARIDFQLEVDGDRMIGREGLRSSIYNTGVLQREVAP
jgi:hypothetical protein